MQAQIVGTIVALTGSATQTVDGQTLTIELDGPVYKGAVLVTDADSHLEVRFTDNTMLSQGQNSEISIDNYVFDADPNTASSILLNLTEGTLRTITGKIAEENPESFEIKSPLATLGIRGTDVVGESSESGDTYTLIKPGLNHFVVISNVKGDRRYLNEPGQAITVNPDDEFAREIEILLDKKREELLEAVPFQSLPNNGLSDDDAPLENDKDDEVLAETTDQESSDELDVNEIQDAFRSGDFSFLDSFDTAAGWDPAIGLSDLYAKSIFTDTWTLYNPVWTLYDPVFTNFTNYRDYSLYSGEGSLGPSDSDANFLSVFSANTISPPLIQPTSQPPAQPTSGQPQSSQSPSTQSALITAENCRRQLHPSR